ncbi:fibronectin type III domain-containing protein, partial [Streptomyces sp. NPDC057565]|uniref:fibronectin type III domain-containing protein n=1 Tax=Streptomyces sp. NPDC057565 TaxID=3346169 RepID=UPI0036A04591
YNRRGGLSKNPPGATGPTSNPFDFSTGNFTVGGSSADTTTPTLKSFSVSGAQATPGSTVTINYLADDDSGALRNVIFQFTDPLGGTPQIRMDGTVSLSGAISQVIPSNWPDGAYTLDYIYLYDPSGNGVIYNRRGGLSKNPPGATGPTSNPFDFSTGNFTVARVPEAPSGVSATGGNQRATVSWAAPSSNGSPITSYTVTASPGGATATTTGATFATMTGLNNGTSYTFTVTATNAIGTGRASAPSAPLTPAPQPPSAPTDVQATAANANAVISWNPPSDDGGSAVTGYTVKASPGGATFTTTGATSATMTGLANGTTYTFTVTATNEVGTGRASQASNAVTPRDPVKPVVTITAGPPSVMASATAQFSFTGSDDTDLTSSLVYRCSLDGKATIPCTSPVSYTSLSSALHTFAVTAIDPSGNESTPTSRQWRVDTVAPTISMTGPSSAFTLSTNLAPAWSVKDAGAGTANVDVRWQRAPYTSGYGAWVYPSAWQKTTATKLTLSGAARGFTYCFSARARDKAGNLSVWSSARCTAVALDDRALTASKGWSRTSGTAYYANTATVTSKSGVTLQLKGVQAKHLALVATRCASCGSIGVYWNGALIKKIDLYAAKAQHKAILDIATFNGIRSGTLTLRTLSSRTVQIDGTALSR